MRIRFRGFFVLQGRRPLRFVTWLAMLAMMLIVVMPVLSRTMTASPALDGECPIHQLAHATHPDSPHAPADPTERCGYCHLLNHTPPLMSDAVVYQAPVAPAVGMAPIQQIGEKPASPRLSADPRGPPAIA